MEEAADAGNNRKEKGLDIAEQKHLSQASRDFSKLLLPFFLFFAAAAPPPEQQLKQQQNRIRLADNPS